ncbi:hypothetical protein GCM10010191_47460 [Actinomadura vinacea]|uniref:Uncharacterized protein n=1 Tax=Actinomadura vinacea TaxID=115336 RepID=A0ABN3JFK1_9ACTN
MWSPKPSVDQFGPSSSPPATGRCIAAPQLWDQVADCEDAARAEAPGALDEAYTSPPTSAAPARGTVTRAENCRLMR